MKESELSDAEKVCVGLAKAEFKAWCEERLAVVEIGKKLLAELEPDIKPVFPEGNCYTLTEDGIISSEWNSLDDEALRGNTFHTHDLAEKEDLRRLAETRVREKINIANKGDNGFKKGGDNYCLELDHVENKIDIEDNGMYQAQFNWEYLRDKEEGDKLLEDKEFVADWLIMKGIKL